MANVTRYLQQTVENLNIEEFILSKLPGIKKVDDKEEIGIGGFTAFVTISEKKNVTASAPDVTLEDGSVIQDTIFLAPIMFDIEGDVSEIHIKRDTTDNPYRKADRIIGVVNQYLPTRTQAQISKVRDLINDGLNTVRRIDSIIDDGRQILDIFGLTTPGTPIQEQFLDTVERLIQGRQLIQLESPYRVYDKVVLLSIDTTRTNQGDNLRFKITAKQIRTATLEFTELEFAPNPSTPQPQGNVDKGATAGEEVEESLLSQILGVFQNETDNNAGQ